jgi:M6 family metalloprotease-like protein
MSLGRFNLILVIILVSNLAYGQCIIPPSPAPYEETLPDGSKITLYTKGSPFNHWQETADGYTVVKNPQGYYEYAMEMNGQLLRSGFQVRPSNARMSSFMPGGISPHLQPKVDEAELQAFMAEVATAVSPLYSSRSRGKITSLNFLVCLVEYPDLRSRFTPAEFEEYFNGIGGEFPSVKEYYLEVSNGELEINFVLSDWVMAQNGFEYYGRQNGYERARELAREGINGATAQGIDFTQFDANGDQVIDGLLMLHAGPGAEEGSRSQYIWSHRWSGINMRISGIYIDSYAAVPETRNWHGRSNGMLGIGVTCHEIGHMLGLPDLYDTRGDGHGIGRWGLMAGGGWEGRENFPNHLCAWSKEQMGWVDVVDISESRGSQRLLPVVDDNTVYRVNTANSEEYFLLENKRTTAAGFESYMPGNGLAIWHIDKRKAKTLIESPSNIVNAYGERGVDLEEADNSNVDISYYTSLFHLYRLNQHFNLDSQPNSNYANIDTSLGDYSGVRIENVRLEGDTVVFDYERRLPGEGENCEDALLAVEGQNKTVFDTTWYTFDMLFDGLAYITAEASDAEFEVEIYQQCQGELIASGKTNTTDPLEVQLPTMEAGDSFVIKWIDAKEGEEQAPIIWNLGVETGEVMIEDSLALVAYYNAMQGADWPEDQKENWLTSPVYAWSGVTVRNNRVISVDLPAPGGTVPEAFFDLTALRSLRLTGGEDEATALFSGGINKLTQLEVIDVSHAQMELDFLDQITSLSSLKEVRITVQSINHPLPQDIDKLSELRVLSIICPDWSTQLPSSLVEIRNLQELTVVSDQLSGALLDISSLESLVLLRIEGPVSGNLPEAIANLTRLEELTISRSALSGPLVAGVFDLPRLRYLDLSYNQFESVPENFLQSPTLSAYYLNHNNIQGTLPAEVNFPDGSISLDLSHNQFSGTLPDWVASTSWSSFNVGYNQLEGAIPQITDDPLVSLVNVEYNRFTAMVTYDFGGESLPPEFAVMCAGNQLSFDDLVPNAEILDNNDGSYEAFLPQDTVHLNMSTSVAFGNTYRIELRRDSALQNVVYYWFNDGEPIDTTTANFLEIENFMPSDTGQYRAEAVYRPEGGSLFDSLTLYYDGIELQAEGKLDQQITYVVPASITYGDGPFRLQASAPAEGDLEFSVVEGQNQVILEEDEVTIVGAGDVKIRAFHPGDDLYNPADTMIAFTIERAEQTIRFAAVDDKTFGDADFTLDVEASSGLPVDLVVEEEQPKIEIEGRTVSIIGAGEVTITARQGGNDNYYPASAVTVGFTIKKQDQLITFALIEDRTFGDPDIVLDIESNRGLPVTITTLTDNIELVDGKLKILAAGTAEVEASQPGTDNYQEAASVQRTFLIDKRSQLIYLDSISDKTLEEGAFEVTANSNAGLKVSLTAVKGSDLVKIEQNDEKFTITPLAVGNVVLQATQPGDENHYAAEPVQEDFYIYDELVEKQYQFITLAEVPQTLEVGDELTLKAKVSSGLPVEISVDGPAQLIRDSVVQVTGPGIIVIRVSQNGNEEYYPADIVERRITVLKGTQQITFEPIPDTVSLDQTIELKAVSSRNNTVLFRVLSGPANIQANVASFFGVGDVSIEAYLLGDELYEPNQVTQTFYVKDGLAPLGGKTQTIDYPQIADNQFAYGDGPVDFPVSSSSRLPVTVEVSGADYVDGQLLITQPGLVTLTLSQAGDDEFEAVEVTVSFTVSKGVQTIEFTSEHIELLNDSTYLLEAIASSELPVQYRIVEGEARMDGNRLIAQASGNVKVEAYQEGDDFYQPTAGYFQTITVDLITSLGGEQPDDWLLYPNPVRHTLQLRLPPSAHYVKYQLLNQQGQQVATGVIDGKELDVREFSKGTYLLGLYLQNRWVFNKIIKVD